MKDGSQRSAAMPDSIFKRLSKYRTGGSSDAMELGMPLPESPTGLVQQRCPTESCRPGLFQIHKSIVDTALTQELAERTRRAPSAGSRTCPYCGYAGEDQSFISAEDRKAVLKELEWMTAQDVADELERMVSNFNRQVGGSIGGLISIHASVQRPALIRPHVWREDLLRDLTCDVCGQRYGVYAIGLFCPNCGASNTHVHFAREVELVRHQCELARKVEEQGDRELAYRLLGNAHEDVVTAFETYQKTIYRFAIRKRGSEGWETLVANKAIGNRFQNIERGRELLVGAGLDPYADMDTEEIAFLRSSIEKRHVVGHNLSMADDKYAATVASSEELGETVQLMAEDIVRFAEACASIIRRVADQCDEFLPRPPEDLTTRGRDQDEQPTP
jgi:hypothetical protein